MYMYFFPSLFSGDHPLFHPPDFATPTYEFHFMAKQPWSKGYNRSNFFENLKLQQSRKFRRQQIIAAQAALFVWSRFMVFVSWMLIIFKPFVPSTNGSK